MRGAARVGGRNFKMPRDTGGGRSYDPFEPLFEDYDLPVAPRLEPINDSFSWSIGADPADPRDCARYPASPYCGEIPFRPGSPFGVTPEIKTNGCETCIYIYPVILWLMATPQVICYRDPNCDKEDPPFDPIERDKPPRYNEDVQPDRHKSPECAERESVINIYHNWVNSFPIGTSSPPDFYGEEVRIMGTANGPKDIFTLPYGSSFYREFSVGEGTATRRARAAGGDTYIRWEITVFYNRYINNVLVQQSTFGRVRIAWIPALCPNMPPPPIIKPPPPARDDDDDREERKRRERDKRRGKEMCCNQCSDAVDNTARLLREIRAIRRALGNGRFETAVNAAVGIGDGSVTAIVNTIAKRIGTNSYPIEVPESLLTGTGDGKVYKAESNAEYLFWLTKQLDALVGEFPIDIEIKDSDPLKKGDQKLNIKIPNIAEAIAEIYGLTFKNSVNQEVELNMLLRLALEVMQTKNAAIVAQEYARGNAQFLGYEGNTKGREIDYNFDITDVNASAKNQNKSISLESLLKNSKAWLVGWENNDKETVVSFLRKLMFSAGIIKAVFFRDKKQTKKLADDIDAMVKDGKVKEEEWDEFVKDVNNPASMLNRDSVTKPNINERR